MTEALSAETAANSDYVSENGTPAPSGRVSVAVVVNQVAGVDPTPTLECVAGQARPAVSVTVIGEGELEDVEVRSNFEDVVASMSTDIDYVWILHGDAEPRPDALAALVDEAERHEASMVGSKLLVGGTRDTLEGVGSATDIFGEPYTGLDEGEVDLEQYDVVRDVAFVSSVSVLVRRDLLKGLGGLDTELAPVAAGLDLSQRVRIAGGRVMVVPSSEVFHWQRCGRGDGGWREQSGRLRAMIKAYTPVTLLWLLPFAVVAGILDSLGSLILGRWRLGPRYLATWGWNIARFPSTLKARRGLSKVRQVGDEELFRYQVRGSVRLRQVGSELSERLMGLLDDDSAITRRATEVWNSASAWGVLAAVLLVLFGVRSIFLGSLPVTGFSLPLAPDASSALARYLGGWNLAGLGTDAPVHPAVGLLSLIQVVLADRPELTRSLVTVAALGLGIFGTGRLARRFGVGGPGAYVGGVVAMFGPAAAVLADSGRWPALLAVGVLPWALSSVVGSRPENRRRLVAAVAATFLWTALMAFLVPLLAVVPLLFALAVKVLGRFPVRFLPAAAGLAGLVVALPYLIERFGDVLGGTRIPIDVPLVAVVVLGVAGVAGMLSGTWRASALGATMTFTGLATAHIVGSESQLAVLVVAAAGTGLVAASALRPRSERNVFFWPSVVAGLAVVALSFGGLATGRAGLGPDQWGDRVAFVGLDTHGVERALLVADNPQDLPGESRPGPGFWYRLIDSEGPTLDQAALGTASGGDAELRAVLGDIVSGGTLEPGRELAPFGIRWVVAVGEVALDLSGVLDAQVDLQPLPLANDMMVYDNTVTMSVAETDDGERWDRAGTGFGGTSSSRVRLALPGDSRWGPDWQPDGWAGTVSGSTGKATFSGVPSTRATTLAGLLLLAGSLVALAWGRRGINGGREQ